VGNDVRRPAARAAGALMLAMGIAVADASAQQRPLVTEDPVTVGAGQVLLEMGIGWARDILFPVSGLRGDLLTAPAIGISVGVGPIAEIQIDGSPYRRLRITERRDAPLAGLIPADLTETSAVEDLVIATKLRLVNEGPGRPALGLRFATRLPNASNESGLGHDTTDFYASFLIAKTARSVRTVGNVGLAIVGDPTVAARQEDLLTFGLSLARAITAGFEVVAEYNGRLNLAEGSPVPGTENRGVARGGLRYTYGPVRFDSAVLVGATPTDLDLGATVGFTWVFNAFHLP
jgi:hypothetical protein